jgi:prepilin-type N-terminal cleavage/methylation domain-containing protein
MKRQRRRFGFTLIELMVVLVIVTVLAALLTMLMSAFVKSQRQALLRGRQRTEYARLDAILRNDVHTATEVDLASPTKCSLTNQQGLQMMYEFRDDRLQRMRQKGEDWSSADSFYLRPGTQVNFRVVKENGRSLLQLNLDLPAEAAPASGRQAPYRGQMLVGGLLPAEQRAPLEEQP